MSEQKWHEEARRIAHAATRPVSSNYGTAITASEAYMVERIVPMIEKLLVRAEQAERERDEQAEEIARLRQALEDITQSDDPYDLAYAALRAPGRASTMLGQPVSDADRDAISKDGP